MLQEAESFAGRCQGRVEAWAEQMETLLTEELDGRLRAHRPRAGRLEEEVGGLDFHTNSNALQALMLGWR